MNSNGIVFVEKSPYFAKKKHFLPEAMNFLIVITKPKFIYNGTKLD
jgi:hypothetical protein